MHVCRNLHVFSKDSYATGSGAGATSASSQAAPAKEAATGINESQPATTLQIRLADGSKLTGRFNLTQTVQDVKRSATHGKAVHTDLSVALSCPQHWQGSRKVPDEFMANTWMLIVTFIALVGS